MRLLFLLLLIYPLSVIAAEGAPVDLEGAFTFSVIDDNALNDSYIEAPRGPEFNSEISLNTIFSELIKNETLEIGMTFDIDEALSLIEEESAYSNPDGSNNNGYHMVQEMIDWYIDNRSRYGMSDYPDGFSGAGWPSTDYGASSDRYQFIIGNTVEDIHSVVWTSTKWSDAYYLFNDIANEIFDEIEKISPGDGSDVEQFHLDGLTVDEKNQLLEEKEAYEDFKKAYRGSSSSVALGDLVSDAYIRFNNLFNVLNIDLEYNGSEVSVGRSIDSVRAGMGESMLGVKIALDLDEETLPGLNASLLTVLTEGEKSSTEDWSSMSYDADDGEYGDLGFLLNASYMIKGLGSLEIEGGLLDVSTPGNFVAALYPTLDIWHMGKLKIAGEFNILGHIDEDNPNDSLKIGMGAALDGQVSFLGLTPRVKILWKNDQFFGSNVSNLAEDRLPGTSMMDDFNSSNVKMSAALDGGLSFSTERLNGRELISVGGGYNLFLYDPLSDSRILRHGWYGNLNVSLLDYLELPLFLDGSISGYYADEQFVFDDFEGSGPAASFADGLSWGVKIRYELNDNVSFSGRCSGGDTGYRLDTSQELVWELSAKTSF